MTAVLREMKEQGRGIRRGPDDDDSDPGIIFTNPPCGGDLRF